MEYISYFQVFFVLKKNYRQVTFLHLYHHAGMVLASWIAVRYLCGGESVWVSALNGVVHVFMFMYYLLTAKDSSWKKVIWMKKMITQIQLVSLTFVTILWVRKSLWLQLRLNLVEENLVEFCNPSFIRYIKIQKTVQYEKWGLVECVLVRIFP